MSVMLMQTIQDSARPLSTFAERMGNSFAIKNMSVRYGETSVTIRFPMTRPLQFREVLSNCFLQEGWTYTSIFDARGIRHGSVVGLRFNHPIMASRVGTEPPNRPAHVQPTIQLPDRRVPLTPAVVDRLSAEAAAVTAALVRNIALHEDLESTARRQYIELRNRDGRGLTDPTAVPGSAYSAPRCKEDFPMTPAEVVAELLPENGDCE